MDKRISFLLLLIFSFNAFLIDLLSCDMAYAAEINLPKAGTLVSLSEKYSGSVLKGIELNPENPLSLSFVIDTQDNTKTSKTEVSKLISYFMAALAIDKDNIWVNLSPYEQDRITDDNLAITELGKDLLEQDYILKQVSASLTHPDTPLGRTYWGMDNGKSTIENDLSKIWIMPTNAQIFETETGAFVTGIDFELETKSEFANDNSLTGLLNEIKDDVNSGRNFSDLRQIYHSVVLAQWFKQKLKDTFFKQYIDKNNLAGIDLEDKSVKDRIWSQYNESFKQGAYDIIKKVRSVNGQLQKKKFFAGGVTSSSLAIEKNLILPKFYGNVLKAEISLTDPNGESYNSSSALEIADLAIPAVSLLVVLLAYKVIKRKITVEGSYDLVKNLFDELTDKYPFEVINAGTKTVTADTDIHNYENKLEDMSKFNIRFFVKSLEDKVYSGDKLNSLMYFFHKLERDLNWHEIKSELSDDDADIRYAMLYLLKDKFKRKHVSFWGTDLKHVLNEIKKHKTDKAPKVRQIATEIYENYSSSALNKAKNDENAAQALEQISSSAIKQGAKKLAGSLKSFFRRYYAMETLDKTWSLPEYIEAMIKYLDNSGNNIKALEKHMYGGFYEQQRPNVRPVYAAFCYNEHAKEYLYKNINEISEVVKKYHYREKYSSYKFFDKITDIKFWQDKQMSNFTPQEIMEMALEDNKASSSINGGIDSSKLKLNIDSSSSLFKNFNIENFNGFSFVLENVKPIDENSLFN